ncbi:hypothetical protein O3G_MSEX014314 [Manduca sexta]|uniref:Uncharacterized protein n=1 Tax=Manduca sexta TaxID=7130 RepID=A0A921ZVS8_MANSE|nr:hypothetical protein O3G_MSEX014314 [Manduca sexta]KAG6464153.1 hypothetical protein O3G_MSEX014314 [Manduca sexta]
MSIDHLHPVYVMHIWCASSWLCAYMAQMNPLIGPRLNNETLIWISRTWCAHANGRQAPALAHAPPLRRAAHVNVATWTLRGNPISNHTGA